MKYEIVNKEYMMQKISLIGSKVVSLYLINRHTKEYSSIELRKEDISLYVIEEYVSKVIQLSNLDKDIILEVNEVRYDEETEIGLEILIYSTEVKIN